MSKSEQNIVAKNNDAHLSLAAQLEDHSLSRVYKTILCGRLKSDGTVDAPIGRHKIKRKQMAVTKENSKPAKTKRYRYTFHFDTLPF